MSAFLYLALVITLAALVCDVTASKLGQKLTMLEKRLVDEAEGRALLEKRITILEEQVQDAKHAISFEKQQRLQVQNDVAVEKRRRASIEEELKSLRENNTLARKEVDGGWGTWSAWTVCYGTCGSHRRNRIRACTRPRPENGGRNCVGNARDEGTCEKDDCFDGGWGTWSAWTVCSVTCGSGGRSRSRDCTRPRPENGGHNCVGNARDEGTCEKDDCPLDGGWGTWSAWTVCSVTCGSGGRSRSRDCTRPRPENGGQNCVGNARDESTCEKDDCPPFTDCWDFRSRGGFNETGVYSITPAPGHSKLQVRCDMTTDGGGWTVLQRRHDGSVDFHQTFKKYEDGFGYVSGEHWLGLKWIHLMTSQGVVEMRVDLCRDDDEAGYAMYDRFNVSGPGDTYRLHAGVYRTGSMGDWLRYHDGQVFQVSGGYCADLYRGGWWYRSSGCFIDANLNGGRYKGGSHHGIMWMYFGGYDSSSLGLLPNVTSSELKIRPINTPRDPTHPYTCPP